MSSGAETTTSTFSSQHLAIESNFPAWDNVPGQTQLLNLKVGIWGSPDAPPERTFLLVHGITANYRWWKTIAEQLLATSSEPLRIIAPDLRGRGDSDKPDGPYSVVVNAADMLGVLNALGISEPINYVGHSLGAHIGVVFASTYSERVRKLVLVDGGAQLPSDVDRSIAPALKRLGQLYPTYADYVAPLKAAGVIPEWDDEADEIYHYDSHAVEGGVMSKVSKSGIDQEQLHLPAFYEAVNSLYPKIAVPTVVLRAPVPINPTLNPFLLPEALETMTTTIAGGARVIDVPGTNHYTILLKPSAEMIKAILD
jgi:pimeloyl-ACP methyl ester carboxylesterase